MSVKNTFKLFLSISIAIAFVLLIFNKINFDEVIEASAKLKWLWIFSSLFMFGLGYSFRIQRWRIMLQVDNPGVKWINCAGPFVASFAINNLLPFRLGDLARSFAFNKKLGVNSGGVLATLLVERLFDLLMVLLFLLGSLYLFSINTQYVFGVGIIALASLVILILFILNFPNLFFPICNYCCKLISIPFPRIGGILMRFVSNIFKVLDRLSKGRMMIILTFWSLVIWTAEGCVFWFVAMGLPSISKSTAAWMALPVGTLATLIPSTPGYLGTFDYFVIQTMQSLGNDIASSAAFTFIVHALLWLPTTIIGGLYIAVNTISLKDLKAAKNE